MIDLRTEEPAYQILVDADARRKEQEWLKQLKQLEWKDRPLQSARLSGISLIVPVYRAHDTIERLVKSLELQTLDKSLFEVVFIFNGEDDGSREKLRNLNPDFEYKEIAIEGKGAGLARNIGISTCAREYMIFVDADDEIQPNFLEHLFAYAQPNRVVMTEIYNVVDGEVIEDNALNNRIRQYESELLDPNEVPTLLGFNACKLFSWDLVSGFRYDEDLKSGEDLVFFSHFFAMEDVEVYVPTFKPESAYLRHITSSSVSRGDDSFDFNVIQRAECIERLMEIKVSSPQSLGFDALISAQAGFIKRYSEDHPEALDGLETHLEAKNLAGFPWHLVNGDADNLVISYCFPPYSDTSAIIAAKVVAEERKVSDVILDDMRSIRSIDESSNTLCERWVSRRNIVKAKPSFNNWNLICEFGEKALAAAKEMREDGSPYKSMYSRALWVGSHLGAALYKYEFPQCEWTAEFSDPLRWGVDGSPRAGQLTNNRIAKLFREVIVSLGYPDLEINTLFDLVEAITFITADRLVFTNENQLEYMLMDYPEEIKELVRSKAIVRPHSAPQERLFHLQEPTYSGIARRHGAINIGYFGAFYKNRGLGNVFTAITNLPEGDRARVLLHIFTNQVSEVNESVAQLGLEENVRVNHYLPYVEFLSSMRLFDVLLLSDVNSSGSLPINPFLPSKYSDYRASGVPIWGLIEEGSPLSELPISYKSPVLDARATLDTLVEILDAEARE